MVKGRRVDEIFLATWLLGQCKVMCYKFELSLCNVFFDFYERRWMGQSDKKCCEWIHPMQVSVCVSFCWDNFMPWETGRRACTNRGIAPVWCQKNATISCLPVCACVSYVHTLSEPRHVDAGKWNYKFKLCQTGRQLSTLFPTLQSIFCMV